MHGVRPTMLFILMDYLGRLWRWDHAWDGGAEFTYPPAGVEARDDRRF
jgi:hypothetical protein